jgi:hypothetical protein
MEVREVRAFEVLLFAYILVIGTPDRFPCGKQVGSYVGLIPCEDSQFAPPHRSRGCDHQPVEHEKGY